MIKVKLFFTIISGILLFLPCSALYASNGSTNIIAIIQGGQYSKTFILRQKDTLHPSLYFEILTGDIIKSQSKQNITVEVKLCSKQNYIKLKPLGSHTFKEKCSENDALSKWFLSFIAAPLDTIYVNSYGEGEPVVAVTRNSKDDDKINLALLQSEASFIKSGMRTLEIKWAGGTPPFRISLLDKDAGVINKSPEINTWEWALPTTNFESNAKYTLLIQDNNGIKTERVISIKNLPENPDWHSELNKLSQTDKDLVIAIWLHDYSVDRRWSLEAYNMLIGRKDTPALLVMDAILNDEDLNIPW